MGARAALASHAVVVDTSVSAAEIDVLPLSAVTDTATGKRDFELLAGLPDTFADGRDELAVKVFRLYSYNEAFAQRSPTHRCGLHCLADRSAGP